MEKTRQYPALSYGLSYFAAVFSHFWQKPAASRRNVLSGFFAQCTQYFDALRVKAQDMLFCAGQSAAYGAPTSHVDRFARQAYENKAFLAMVMSRDDGIAPSWGEAGNDHVDPCTKRGRQQKWYKEFWPLHSQRFSRWWLYRAVRTVLHYRSLRTRPAFKRSIFTARLTSHPSRGWACRPARCIAPATGAV